MLDFAMLDRDIQSIPHHTSTSVWATNDDLHLSTRIIPAGSADDGGDWCEAFSLTEDVTVLSIGDVCGHGAERAAAMMLVRQTIRDAALAGMSPDEILSTANRFVYTLGIEYLSTALIAFLDTTDRTITFANCGHPSPLLVVAQHAWFLSHGSSDLALGINAATTPRLHTETLPPGSLLVLYTDGVTEREKDLLRGETDLCVAATLAHEIGAWPAASIIEDLLCLSGSNHDDAAIMTVSLS